MSIRLLPLLVGMVLVGGVVLSHVVEGFARSGTTASAAVTGYNLAPYNGPELRSLTNGDPVPLLRFAGGSVSKSSSFFRDCMDLQLIKWGNMCKRQKKSSEKSKPQTKFDSAECIRNLRDKALRDYPQMCRGG